MICCHERPKWQRQHQGEKACCRMTHTHTYTWADLCYVLYGKNVISICHLDSQEPIVHYNINLRLTCKILANNEWMTPTNLLVWSWTLDAVGQNRKTVDKAIQCQIPLLCLPVVQIPPPPPPLHFLARRPIAAPENYIVGSWRSTEQSKFVVSGGNGKSWWNWRKNQVVNDYSSQSAFSPGSYSTKEMTIKPAAGPHRPAPQCEIYQL